MDDSGVKKPRKPRSKSLGPGGLEALNAQGRAASSSSSSKGKKRRESVTPKAPVKSILLPTAPVSPVRPKIFGKLTARRRTSLLNIPSLNMPPKPSNDSPLTGSGSDNMTRSIPVRTEEEQAAAARARQRKEVLASRAERRKSLGNRRVSFATEATLHTFVVDDYPPTPSSAGATSRDSTPGQPSRRRRQSGSQYTKKFDSSSSDEDENEAFSSSPIAPDGLGRLVGPGEAEDANDSNSSSSGGEGESDFEDTLGSKKSVKGKKKDPFPNIAPIDFDEDEEIALAKKGEDITISAKGMMKNFFKKPIRVIHSDMTQPGLLSQQTKPEPKKPKEDDDGDMTMDMTTTVGGFLSNPSPPDLEDMDMTGPPAQDNAGEVTMGITRPIGGLISSMRNAAKQIQKHLKPTVLFGGSSSGGDTADNGGEMTMDMTRAVGGILAKAPPPAREGGGDDGEMEMDMTVTVGGLLSKILGSRIEADADGDAIMDTDMTMGVGGQKRVVEYPSLPEQNPTDEDGDMPMDMTVSVGRILEQQKTQTKAQAKAAFEEDDGQNVDFTVAVGGIKKGAESKEEWTTDGEDESMDESETMDLTAVVGGGVVKNAEVAARKERGGKGRRGSAMGVAVLMSGKEWEKEQEAERQLQQEANQDAGAKAKEKEREEEKKHEDGDVDMGFDEDVDMEFTAIIPSAIQQLQKEPIRELLVKTPTPKKTPPKMKTPPSKEKAKQATNLQAAPVSLFYGNKAIESLPSPGLAALKASLDSPIKSRKQVAEVPAAKSSSSKKVTRFSMDKERLSISNDGAKEPVTARVIRSLKESEGNLDTSESTSTPKQATLKSVTFKPGALETPPPAGSYTTSAHRRLSALSNPSTPSTKSPKRRLSGIGIDKPGLGSPALVASLSRRKSIGENSPFRVGATDPRETLFEALRAAAEEKKEEKRKADEAYAEDMKRLEKAKDETVDLKSRIENMTPRKAVAEAPAKGKRKSSAFEDGGHEEDGGVKRDLFGEVTGTEKRDGKRRSLGLDNPLPVEPEQKKPEDRRTRSKTSLETSEKGGKRKKAVVISPQKPAAAPPPAEQEEEAADEEPPRITVARFLDITGISFLDNITHTKRRQTLAGGARKTLRVGPSAFSDDFDEEPSLGEWIIAGAATAAVYQLFWSSCTQLKRYIADGKAEMRRIEKGINANNPEMFKEYMNAPADLKLIMDSQFKSIKTHSRLLAKKDWYNWRTNQLLELNKQLEENLGGLKKDEEVIKKQGEILEGVLPGALRARAEMKRRLEKLVERRREVEDCDQQELEEARRRLVELRKEVDRMKAVREQKKKEAEELEKGVEERKGRMEWLRGEIERAERVREMNRGFGEDEVWLLRCKASKMEEKYGWSIVSVENGSVLSMVYRGQILLVFDA
ncbi:Spc7 kinetochore protein-domain-containing protein, partial [Tirmania nivea]